VSGTASQHGVLRVLLGSRRRSCFGLAIAHLLASAAPGQRVLRLRSWCPWAIPAAVSGKIWAWLLQPGVRADHARSPGQINWLGTPRYAMPAATRRRRLEDGAFCHAPRLRARSSASPRISTAQLSSDGASCSAGDLPLDHAPAASSRRSPWFSCSAPPRRLSRLRRQSYVLTAGGPRQHHRDAGDLHLKS